MKLPPTKFVKAAAFLLSATVLAMVTGVADDLLIGLGLRDDPSHASRNGVGVMLDGSDRGVSLHADGLHMVAGDGADSRAGSRGSASGRDDEDESAEFGDGSAGSSANKAGAGAESGASAESAGEQAPAEPEAAEESVPIDETPAFDPDQQINPFLDGFLEAADKKRIRGIAWDTSDRTMPLIITIEINGEDALTLNASKKETHKTHGEVWRFHMDNPPELQASELYRVRAFATRRDRPGRKELRWSNRSLAPDTYPRGKLEGATPELGITGYAWDPENSGKAVEVVLEVDGQRIGKTRADRDTPLLAERRIGPKKAGFRFEWPAVLNDGASHLVRVHAVLPGSSSELKELEDSPRTVGGSFGATDSAPEGNFDIANNAVLGGYAWDPDNPSASLDVEIHIDGQLYLRMNAASPRHSLKSSRVTPNETHGFVLPTPTAIRDGQTHIIRVYAVNEPRSNPVMVELDGSPKYFRAESNSMPMGGFWRADEKLLRGWAVDPDLGLAPCEIEIYIDDQLWQRTVADYKESWMDGAGYAPNNTHGFAIKPPPHATDGQMHTVDVYAIDAPSGTPRHLGRRTIGVKSVFAGFWFNDRLLDTRIAKGLQVTSVSTWFDAYHQGVRKGDVLLAYAGTEATTSAEFATFLQTKKANDRVKMKFWRDGSEFEADIKLGELLGQ